MLLAVGNICTQWAFLEYQLAIAIWSLLGLDEETGKIVTGGLDIMPRATMILSLTHGKKGDQTLSRAATKVLKELRGGLVTRRNEAVHGVYSSQRDGSEPMVEVHRGKGGRNPKPIGPDDLERLAQEISQSAQIMTAALDKLKITHPESGNYLGPSANSSIEPPKTRSSS